MFIVEISVNGEVWDECDSFKNEAEAVELRKSIEHHVGYGIDARVVKVVDATQNN